MTDSLSGRGPVKRDFEVPTPAGPARVDVVYADAAAALVVLGHSAGGDAHAPVLLSVRAALAAAGFAVALVDQPYRIAGRRMPDRADRLDAAMLAVTACVRAEVSGVPLVVGGKSSGARVGCRIASHAGAVGVIALGFPLLPPGRPENTRAEELNTGCPVLVVQGTRDQFGGPEAVSAARRGLPVTVHAVAGADHSFVARRSDGRSTADCLAEVAGTVTAWLSALLR